MRVDIEEFNEHLNYFKRINRDDIKELTIFENGIEVEINPSYKNEFRLTGLSNKDFVEMRFWENKIEGEE